MGSLPVTTNASGIGSFTATFAAVPAGQFVTATATDPSGNTSEFSAAVQIIADVTSQVRITRSGFRYNNATGHFLQTVTIKNTSSSRISGPISLVLEGLSSNATLYNKKGTTGNGNPYIDLVLSLGYLDPGASVSIVLEFVNPSRQGITYTPHVLAGSGPR